MKALPTLRQLRFLVALADRRHFGQAAEACFVSQSTLSAAIQGTTSPNSLSANGYQVFPGGLILNWGTGTTVTGSGSVTFSKAFTTACFVVLAIPTGSAAATVDSLIASSAPTTTGSNIYCASAASLSFFYVALGR